MYSVSTPILGPNRAWLRIAMKRRSSEKRHPATGWLNTKGRRQFKLRFYEYNLTLTFMSN